MLDNAMLTAEQLEDVRCKVVVTDEVNKVAIEAKDGAKQRVAQGHPSRVIASKTG